MRDGEALVLDPYCRSIQTASALRWRTSAFANHAKDALPYKTVLWGSFTASFTESDRLVLDIVWISVMLFGGSALLAWCSYHPT